VHDHAFVDGRKLDDLTHREVLAVAEHEHSSCEDLGRRGRFESGPNASGLVLVGEVDLQVLLVVAQVDCLLVGCHPSTPSVNPTGQTRLPSSRGDLTIPAPA